MPVDELCWSLQRTFVSHPGQLIHLCIGRQDSQQQEIKEFFFYLLGALPKNTSLAAGGLSSASLTTCPIERFSLKHIQTVYLRSIYNIDQRVMKLEANMRTFLVSIQKEDKFFVARCPELDVTSQGNTLEEAWANIFN